MVPTPAKSTPLHTLVPAGIAEQTAWTLWAWARPLPSVPVGQVPAPQESTVPPALPQNVTLPRWCLALLQLLLRLDPVGPSGLQCRRPVPEPRLFAVSPPCLQCTQPRVWFAGGRGAERGGGGGGHGTGAASTVAALCWQRCAGPAMSLSPQGAAAVPTSFPLHPLAGCSSHRSLNTGTALPALAVSPATGSPSFPHSGFAQRCHILPQSMSPYPLSQEELPWAVSPLLPWAQHSRTGTHTATSSPGLTLPRPHQCPAGCRQDWGHAGPHEHPCPYRSPRGGR